MDMTDPSGLITEGHRLVERGATLATAVSTVPQPDLGFPAPAVTDGLAALSNASWDLADLLTETGDDLAFVARSFVDLDGQVGELYARLAFAGRFG